MEELTLTEPTLTEEEQRRRTLERMYEIHGFGRGGILEQVKTYYYLTL